MSVFGFSTEPAVAVDFTPIVKYDARSGRFFRVDRVDAGSGFENNPVDITPTFKAIIDFDNIETGWMLFQPGSAPSLILVPLESLKTSAMPPRPTEQHKNGIRLLLKLAKPCAGDKSVRELAGTSKAFLSGIETVYKDFQAQKAKYPGKLPVVVLDGAPRPVKTGSGAQASTNYKPVFKIDGWSPRPPDLVYSRPSEAPVEPLAKAPPATGSTKPQPAAPEPEFPETEDDFG